MAAFNRESCSISVGTWFATTDETPGLDGVADLLPTNRLRGFDAFEDEGDGLGMLDELSAMSCAIGNFKKVFSSDDLCLHDSTDRMAVDSVDEISVEICERANAKSPIYA